MRRRIELSRPQRLNTVREAAAYLSNTKTSMSCTYASHAEEQRLPRRKYFRLEGWDKATPERDHNTVDVNMNCMQKYSTLGAGIRINPPVNHADFSNSLARSNFPSASFSATPTSVIIPSINSAGVTSNAGFQISIPCAAMATVSMTSKLTAPASHRGPLMIATSWLARSSMVIFSPLRVCKSIVVRGAATKNLMPWCLARMA